MSFYKTTAVFLLNLVLIPSGNIIWLDLEHAWTGFRPLTLKPTNQRQKKIIFHFQRHAIIAKFTYQRNNFESMEYSELFCTWSTIMTLNKIFRRKFRKFSRAKEASRISFSFSDPYRMVATSRQLRKNSM